MTTRRFLVDTSAYSRMARGSEAIARALYDAELVCINTVVLGELLAGFFGGTQRERNQAEFAAFLRDAQVRLLTLGPRTAESYAVTFTALKARGKRIPTNDLWIAASAMEHGLCLITADRHFAELPFECEMVE